MQRHFLLLTCKKRRGYSVCKLIRHKNNLVVRLSLFKCYSLRKIHQGVSIKCNILSFVFQFLGDDATSTISDLDKALKADLRKEDLADFFNENREGKLTKTKTIYMIYSMMSDYGTHRNESIIELPIVEDALFCLRLTDSILFWVYSKNK